MVSDKMEIFFYRINGFKLDVGSMFAILVISNCLLEKQFIFMFQGIANPILQIWRLGSYVALVGKFGNIAQIQKWVHCINVIIICFSVEEKKIILLKGIKK